MTTTDRETAALKHEARSRARAARALAAAAGSDAAGDALADRLTTIPELQRAGAVLLAYAALPEEIDPSAAICRLAEMGVRTAFPRIESEGVLGLHFAAESQLARSRYGIREPLASAQVVAPAQVDVAFVPGVAFDELGFRLGYGGGYYDRLLPLLRPGALTIGLAYEEQLTDELPCEEHDVRLDIIVTPERIIRPS